MRAKKVAVLTVSFAIVLGAVSATCAEEQKEIPKSIKLLVGETLEIAFDGLTKAVVKDASVASTMVLSSGRLLIQGLKRGETMLTLWVGEEKRNVPLTVTADKSKLAAETDHNTWLPEAANEPDTYEGQALAAQVWVSVDVDQTKVLPGGRLNYLVSFGNRGREPAQDVRISVKLPEGLTYVDGSAIAGGWLDQESNDLRWQFDKVEPMDYESGQVSFTAEVSKNLRVGSKLSTQARIESNGSPVQVQSSTVSVEVISSPLLAAFALPDTFVVKKSIGMPMLDVKRQEYQQAVDRLEGLGILHGYPDRCYRPQKPVNRAETAKLIVLGADYKDYLDYTRIGYILGEEATVDVTIHDQKGNLVATLLKGKQQKPVEHYVVWDGRTSQGRYVKEGTYEFRVQATNNSGTQTILAGLVRALRSEHPFKGEKPTFRDVKPKHWFFGYVGEAERRDYVKGYPDRTFRPLRHLSRAEATAIIVRALGLEEEAKKRQEEEAGFLDDPSIPKWARGYIAVFTTQAPKAKGKPIIEYSGNRFLPQKPLTRAEVAAMLSRFLDRDVERAVTIAGTLAPGASLSINGEVIHDQPTEFQKQIRLRPGVNVITVLSR